MKKYSNLKVLKEGFKYEKLNVRVSLIRDYRVKEYSQFKALSDMVMVIWGHLFS